MDERYELVSEYYIGNPDYVKGRHYFTQQIDEEQHDTYTEVWFDELEVGVAYWRAKGHKVEKQKFVGVNSYNYLVGRIKYENHIQNKEIDDKLDEGEEFSILDVLEIWNNN